MLVHFAGSQWNITDQIEDFRKIVGIVHDQGHSLTRDWVESTYSIAKKGKDFSQQDWPTIYKENMEAIARADVVIIEATVPSFAVGYQSAMALQQKKPTLLLVHGKENLDSNFVSGLDDNLLTSRVYDKDSLEKVLLEFLSRNQINSKDLRFNFFIDRQIYNYLRWASFKTGKTKAEILRELVQREIETKDY